MILKELEYAQESVNQMTSAVTMEAYEKAWKDCLGYLITSRNKCLHALKDNPRAQRYLDQMTHDLRSDGLISYVLHARNCNQHSIRQIVETKGSYTTVTGGEGGGTIVRGSISGDKQPESLVTTGNLIVKFTPARLEVIAVIDSDREYQPPSDHLGQRIETRIPHELAQMALQYFSNRIESAFSAVQRA